MNEFDSESRFNYFSGVTKPLFISDYGVICSIFREALGSNFLFFLTAVWGDFGEEGFTTFLAFLSKEKFFMTI